MTHKEMTKQELDKKVQSGELECVGTIINNKWYSVYEVSDKFDNRHIVRINKDK